MRFFVFNVDNYAYIEYNRCVLNLDCAVCKISFVFETNSTIAQQNDLNWKCKYSAYAGVTQW